MRSLSFLCLRRRGIGSQSRYSANAKAGFSGGFPLDTVHFLKCEPYRRREKVAQLSGEKVQIGSGEGSTWYVVDLNVIKFLLYNLHLFDSGYLLDDAIGQRHAGNLGTVWQIEDIGGATGELPNSWITPSTGTRGVDGNSAVADAVSDQRHSEIQQVRHDDFM